MAPSEKVSSELDDVERWQIVEIKKGLKETNRGDFASTEEMAQVLKPWTREKNRFPI
jgi:predicted transcriptional regulator